MSTEQQTYAQKLRSKMKKEAEDQVNNFGANSIEWSPKDVGSYKIRILPPVTTNEKGQVVDNPEGLFYDTHSFHFLDGVGDEGKGRYVFSKKKYTVDDKQVKDPIDEAVSQWYASKDDMQIAIAKKAKRKRKFYFNILLLEENGKAIPTEEAFKVMVDTSGEGKLTRRICDEMGVPFYKDVEDKWVDKNSVDIDEEKEYKDLIDIDNGHDFKIQKSKTGNDAWDISYEKSFAIQKPRALTDEEKAQLKKRIDLSKHVAYEQDYSKVRDLLDKFIDHAASKAKQPESKPESKAQKTEPKKAAVDNDISEEELLKELE